MDIRYRPMRPKDVAECTEIIAAHPIIGPRYGSAIANLRPAWLRLLECEAKCAAVFEEMDRSRARICFVGVSVFVSDDFVRELKRAPLFWFGPELARRILRGDSPLLSDRQVREANSCGGLNLLVWEGCIHPDYEKNGEIYRKSISAFIEEHRGFLWKELIAQQIESLERLHWTVDTGGLIWNPESGRYVKSLEKDPRKILREPHILGVTSEIDRSRPGSWVGTLFDYHAPQIGFSRGEQKLLLSALSGRTDEEVSGDLGASLSTVKNRWRAIYNRAMSCLPELFLDQSQTDGRMSERGKEKKRHLLAYLRDHPEELRPLSRKHWKRTAKRRLQKTTR